MLTSFFRIHWSSLLMLPSAFLGVISVLSIMFNMPTISQRLGIPDYAVTIWEKDAERREEEKITKGLLLIFFGPVIVLFILEFFSRKWGIWFTIVRTIIMFLHFGAAGFVLYSSLTPAKRL